MKHRKLQIAWSVAWGVAGLLLIALWVRSYWYHFHFSYVGDGQATVFAAQDGEFIFGRTFGRSEGPGRWSFIFAPIRPFGISTGPSDIRPEFYAFRHSDSYGIGIPIWFTVLLAAMLAALSWIRFSLRTLLIGMTAVAIGLGSLVYALRK